MFISIVSFALVDEDYNFIYANVECQNRISDGGVFKNCELYKQIENKNLRIPQASPLPQRIINVPYVIVADEAFPLTEHIMKHFSGIHTTGSKERIFILLPSKQM